MPHRRRSTAPNSTPSGCRSPPTASSRRTRACSSPREGMHYWTADGQADPRRLRGPVVRQRRPRPPGDHRGRQRGRSRRSTTRRRSRWVTRRRSSSRTRSCSWLPAGLDHVFFTNSGSESVDTALKIALAYHRVARRGHAHAPDRPRARLSRRQLRRHLRRRHGQQPQVLRRAAAGRRSPAAHARPRAANAFTRGLPEHGAELADELERLVALHDATNIAAVIVEPVAGSTGVLIPPRGYLQRLREICTSTTSCSSSTRSSPASAGWAHRSPRSASASRPT